MLNEQVGSSLVRLLDSLALKVKEYQVGQFLQGPTDPVCTKMIHMSPRLDCSITYWN